MALIDEAVVGDGIEFVGASPQTVLLRHVLDAAAGSGRAAM
jgi:predicted nicotinamide N-methyase